MDDPILGPLFVTVWLVAVLLLCVWLVATFGPLLTSPLARP